MLMHKKRLFILLILSVFAITAIFLFFWPSTKTRQDVSPRQTHSKTFEVPHIEPQNISQVAGDENLKANKSTPVTQSSSATQTYEQARKEITDLPGMGSPEHTAWRTKNIIPDLTMMDSYLQRTLVDLQELAERGDVLAQIALGNKLIREEHNSREGLYWLIEAASHGSQEALRNLRWIYQLGAGEIEPDQYAFLAWSKVAYMLGDWQALWPFGTKALSEIGVKNSLIVEIMAANYFSEINERHFARTGQNMSISLRPGYEEALRQFMNESDAEQDHTP